MCNRLLPVSCARHFDVEHLQNRSNDLQIHLIVIDHKNSFARKTHGVQSLLHLLALLAVQKLEPFPVVPNRLLGDDFLRKLHDKARTLPVLTLHTDSAVHQFDKPRSDAKPQPSPLDGSVLEPVQPLKLHKKP